MDGYRFSTSWARVMPEGRGHINQDGLDYYDRLVDAMLARGLKPYQTLYHWEMPSALADLGGWTNPDVADWFADFTEVITKRIGDRVDAIATLNEPWCVAFLSHFIGAHAPGHMPAGWEDDMPEISQKMDWLGVNYYTRHKISHDATSPWPHMAGEEGPGDKTQMGWEIYPDGLYSFLTRLSQDYVGDMPMYVTENGMAWDDKIENGAVFDPVRVDFIDRHMDATRRAIADGANVKGFFYWSLLDNYEWALGYEKRFGMIHVDFETLVRTPKASYHALNAAIAR